MQGKSRRFTRRIFSVSRYTDGPGFEGRRTGPASEMSTSRPIDFHPGYEAFRLAENPADLLGGFFRFLATSTGLDLKAVGPVQLQT